MAKDKKHDKNSGKGKKKGKGRQPDDLLDNAVRSLKKFRKVTRNVTKLSTGQKVVGGIALLAAGLTYLAKKQSETQPPAATPDAQAAEAALTALSEPADPADTDEEFSAPEPAAPAPAASPAKAGRKGRKHGK